MRPFPQALSTGRLRRIARQRRRRRRDSAGVQPGIEGLEPRSMLAGDAPDILVGLVGNRVTLTLDPSGVAITNLATTYDAPAARLTIVAETAGRLGMAAPANGITIDPEADTITVNLKQVRRFAGLSVVGGEGTDSVRIGPGGVNLAVVRGGSAAQGFVIDTGAGVDDSIAIAGRIATKGTGTVSLATRGEGVTHGILMASGIVTAGGSQSFTGGVTLLDDVSLRAGGDIAFASTVDGFGRLDLSARRAITLAGDVGSALPLQGISVARARRVFLDGGLVLDGSGTAAGTSGFVIGANVHRVVFSPVAQSRTISGFGGAGIRFVGGSSGSRITSVTSRGNGVGMLVGPGAYRATVVSGSSFSGNVGDGVSLQAARGLVIGGKAPGAASTIVSNGGYGVAAAGACAGTTVVGSEIGDNTLGQVRNYLASTLVGGRLTQNATGLRLELDDVGRAAYRAQKAGRYSFDVGVEAFAVSAGATGWLDTRGAVLDIDASVGFVVPPPGSLAPPLMQRTVLGENRLATSLTPVKTLPGLEFARSVRSVGSDAYGRHYQAVVGSSTFAGMIPLADLQPSPSIGRDDSPVPVDVWLNAQGGVSRIAAAFAGGAFRMTLRGQGATAFVPAIVPPPAAAMNVIAEASGKAAAPSAASAEPLLPGLSNGVSGVRVGRSTLTISYTSGVQVPADWYFPTQVDGSIAAQGVTWLQHASGVTGESLAELAVDLARQTNSIVVAPSLPHTMNWALGGDSVRRALASLFEGDRSALAASAAAAGFAGDASAITGKFVLAGHSTGGGFMTGVAADYTTHNPAPAKLVGVILYDGVARRAFDGSGGFAADVAALDARSVPIYQVAAPAQLANAYGATTNVLMATNPGRFRGVVLAGGSPVDTIVGASPSDDVVAQRMTTRSLPGNQAAVRRLTVGWINDLFAGITPEVPARYGFYAAANHVTLLGDAAATALPGPAAHALSAGESAIRDDLAALGGLLGFQAGPAVNSGTNGLFTDLIPQDSNGVTGVKAATSSLAIPCGPQGYQATAEWYFPTQADGRIAANGLVWLQHGETRDTVALAALATRIAAETNSIVVAPTMRVFETPTQPEAFLGSPTMKLAVADMMRGDRGALAISAATAGYAGELPRNMLFVGERAGGGFAAEAGAAMVDNGAAADLLGVVMIDGVAGEHAFAVSVAKLDSLGIPIYQIALAPQAGNNWGGITEALAALHPDQFIGVQLEHGAALDATIAFATGWINDIHAGSGPTSPLYGFYGSPNDGTFVANQRIVMGDAGASTLPAPPPVDLNQYAGRWYEQASVKQGSSVALVNVSVTYLVQPDGTMRVEYAGNHPGPDGAAWSAVGTAVAVNRAHTRFSVVSSGDPGRSEPGNYWILDYAPDYSWAIVGDSRGTSGSILTREQVIPQAMYDALVSRAAQLDERLDFTRTPLEPAG